MRRGGKDGLRVDLGRWKSAQHSLRHSTRARPVRGTALRPTSPWACWVSRPAPRNFPLRWSRDSLLERRRRTHSTATATTRRRMRQGAPSRGERWCDALSVFQNAARVATGRSAARVHRYHSATYEDLQEPAVSAPERKIYEQAAARSRRARSDATARDPLTPAELARSTAGCRAVALPRSRRDLPGTRYRTTVEPPVTEEEWDCPTSASCGPCP